MINSGNLGLAALLTGETDTARDAFREELDALPRNGRPARGVRRPPRPGRRRRGATATTSAPRRLVGAADAHRYDKPEDPVEARLEEAFFEPARTRCGTDAWDAAAREGSALSFEDAIAYALEEPPVTGRRIGMTAPVTAGGPQRALVARSSTRPANGIVGVRQTCRCSKGQA